MRICRGTKYILDLEHLTVMNIAILNINDDIDEKGNVDVEKLYHLL